MAILVSTQITGSLNVSQSITCSLGLFGTSSWSNNTITASYVEYSRPRIGVYTMTDAAILQTDGNIADHFRVTLGDNRTLARATSSYDGQRITWEFIQDGSGTRTITLGTGYVTGSTFSVQLNQTASKRDFMVAMSSGSGVNATWYIVGFSKDY